MPRRRKDVNCVPIVSSNHNMNHTVNINSTVCSKEKPLQRNAANARERARMRVLSRAFCRLKTTLPWVPVDTKLSKLDTLRLATTYISHLRSVLVGSEGISGNSTSSSPLPSHPLSMSWPFIFNKSNTSNSPLTESESSDCQYSFQECRSTNNLQSSNENVLHPNNPMNVQPTDFSFSNVQIDINYHDLN